METLSISQSFLRILSSREWNAWFSMGGGVFMITLDLESFPEFVEKKLSILEVALQFVFSALTNIQGSKEKKIWDIFRPHAMIVMGSFVFVLKVFQWLRRAHTHDEDIRREGSICLNPLEGLKKLVLFPLTSMPIKLVQCNKG